MARGMRGTTDTTAETGMAMPVDELRGRAVWTEAGDRIGTLRGFHTDDDGRIVALDVRHGWMFGSHHEVDATDMRMEGGDVVVPNGAVRSIQSKAPVGAAAMPVAASVAGTDPVLLAGRAGARSRYGGLDFVAGLIGALVAVASFLLVGGLLSAIFDTGVIRVSTATTSWDVYTTDTILVGLVTLGVASLLGGWAAGRAARFSGVANGMLAVAWIVGLGAVFGLMGELWGAEYDLFAIQGLLPQLDWSDPSFVGFVAMLIGLAGMLACGALGGALGALRNHRVDRRMFDVVEVGTVSGVAYADDAVRSEQQVAVDDMHRHDAGVMGTPAGSPVAPTPLPTRDSPDDVTRPR